MTSYEDFHSMYECIVELKKKPRWYKWWLPKRRLEWLKYDRHHREIRLKEKFWSSMTIGIDWATGKDWSST